LRHPSVTLRRRRNEFRRLATAGCRGDLASWHPRKGAETTNGARLQPRGLQSSRRRVLADTVTVASTAPVAGRDRPEIDAPESASSRCPSAQGRPDEGRTSLPTSVAEWRRMPSVAPTSLAGRGTARQLTRSGADSREAHEEPSRPTDKPTREGRICSSWLPAPRSRGERRLSSGHSSGPSTCPQERVFKSFP